MNREKLTRTLVRMLRTIEAGDLPAPIKEVYVFGSYARLALEGDQVIESARRDWTGDFRTFRITRALRSLTELGMKQEANALLHWLEQAYADKRIPISDEAILSCGRAAGYFQAGRPHALFTVRCVSVTSRTSISRRASVTTIWRNWLDWVF